MRFRTPLEKFTALVGSLRGREGSRKREKGVTGRKEDYVYSEKKMKSRRLCHHGPVNGYRWESQLSKTFLFVFYF